MGVKILSDKKRQKIREIKGLQTYKSIRGVKFRGKTCEIEEARIFCIFHP